MPIHDYRCSDCGNVSEIMTGIGTHTDTVQCKQCGSTSIKKVPVVASIAKNYSRPHGKTCCGRDERCDTPPCSSGGPCCSD